MGEQYTAKVKKVIQLAESFAKKAKRNYKKHTKTDCKK